MKIETQDSTTLVLRPDDRYDQTYGFLGALCLATIGLSGVAFGAADNLITHVVGPANAALFAGVGAVLLWTSRRTFLDTLPLNIARRPFESFRQMGGWKFERATAERVDAIVVTTYKKGRAGLGFEVRVRSGDKLVRVLRSEHAYGGIVDAIAAARPLAAAIAAFVGCTVEGI